MRTLPALLAALAVLSLAGRAPAADDDDSWSPAVNGLQGRLSFASKGKVNGTPIIATYLELRNATDVADTMEIPWDHRKVEFTVVDANGKALAPADGPFDGISVEVGLIRLPWDSRLRFNISEHGAGIPKDQLALLDLGPLSHWTFKAGDEKAYYLRAKITIDDGNERHWKGTLELPKVRIPTVRDKN